MQFSPGKTHVSRVRESASRNRAFCGSNAQNFRGNVDFQKQGETGCKWLTPKPPCVSLGSLQAYPPPMAVGRTMRCCSPLGGSDMCPIGIQNGFRISSEIDPRWIPKWIRYRIQYRSQNWGRIGARILPESDPELAQDWNQNLARIGARIGPELEPELGQDPIQFRLRL